MAIFSIEAIREDIRKRMDRYTHSAAPTDDECRIAFLVGEYDKLQEDNKRVSTRMVHLAAAHNLNATKIFEAGPLEAALAKIEELEAELADWQRYCAIVMRKQQENK